MENGLKYKEIQKLYDDAFYQQINVNWLEKAKEIYGKLGMSFVKKRAALELLAQQAANYHDNAESTGIPKTATKLEDLDSSIYLDSDKIKTFFNISESKYSHDHSHSVFNHSSVKFPTLVPKTNKKVIQTVWWSSNLEKVFHDNFRRDHDIRYQYFGSTTGMFRSFPVRSFGTGSKDLGHDYDPRVRPWYIAAITKPKNVIIIFDTSSTMAKSKPRALAVTQAILNTLTNRDYVSVIVSRSSYYDVNGKYFDYKPYVLGCSNLSALLPSNPSFSFKLFYLLEKLKMDGASNHTAAFKLAFDMLSQVNNRLCHSLILFVTDGITLDGSQRCNSGQYYYEFDGTKRFVPGSICIFDRKRFEANVKYYQSLLVAQKLPIAFIFTFTVSEHAHSYVKKFSCENYGLNIEAWDHKIRTFKALSPYYHFLQSLFDARHESSEQIWISPYLDALNSELIITASKAVFSNKNGKFIGVVGIDVTLDSIEKILSKETWNSVSYFIIDKYGHAILHPLIKHSEELIGDPIFVHISLLEQFDGKPSKFDNVVKRMLGREVGTEIIKNNALLAIYNGEYQEGLSWKPIRQIDYTFGPLQGSDFAFAFKIPFSDNLFTIPSAPLIGQPNAFLTDYNGYLKLATQNIFNPLLTREISSFIDSFLTHKFKDLLSYNYSAIHLSPKAFCSPEEYMFHNNPSLETLHIILNTPHQTEPCTSDSGIIKPYIKSDIALTSKMENVWKARDTDIQNIITSTFISTFSGVTRVYPAMQVVRSLEPLKQAWFNKALLNIVNSYRILTISRAIMLGKPQCNIDHDRNYNDRDIISNDGCSCKRNSDCHSKYCYLGSWCANSITHAVAGINVIFDSLRDQLYQTIKKKLSPDRHCNSIYPCPSDPTTSCTISCIIINNSTQIVIHPNFSSHTISNSENDLYENLYLETNEPLLFYHLSRMRIIYHFFSTDFQAVCVEDSNSPLHFEFQNTESTTEKQNGKHTYNCIKQITLYAVNHSYIQSLSSNVFSLNINESSKCLYKIFITYIPNSNLYLIVQDDLPLVNLCSFDSNFNTSNEKKKEFSLCKDYSYAKTFSSNKINEKNPITYTQTCPLPKLDFNEKFCSGSFSILFSSSFFKLVALFLLTRYLNYFV
ncbi:unnamed protein product [Gordionus sp. m RMFG-2023]